MTLLVQNWTNFAPTWEKFVNTYQKLNFDKDSFLQINGPYQKDSTNNITINTKDISDDIDYHYGINQEHGGIFSVIYFLYAEVYVWHNDHEVILMAYSQRTTYFVPHNSTVSIKLTNFSFY